MDKNIYIWGKSLIDEDEFEEINDKNNNLLSKKNGPKCSSKRAQAEKDKTIKYEKKRAEMLKKFEKDNNKMIIDDYDEEFIVNKEYQLEDKKYLVKQYEKYNKKIKLISEKCQVLEDNNKIHNKNNKDDEELTELYKEYDNFLETQDLISGIMDDLGILIREPIKKIVEPIIKKVEPVIKIKHPVIKRNIVKIKDSSFNIRYEKGSERAKEANRIMNESKKRLREINGILTVKEKANQKRKIKLDLRNQKLKPWYYIGIMPKGYREATEEEALKGTLVGVGDEKKWKMMVGEKGKYIVNKSKYDFIKYTGVLIPDELPKEKIFILLKGFKKNIERTFREIEILKLKLENEKNKENVSMKENLHRCTERHNSLVNIYDNLYIKLYGPSKEGYEEFKKKRDIYSILS